MKDPIEHNRCIAIRIKAGDKKIHQQFLNPHLTCLTEAIRFNVTFWQSNMGLSAGVFIAEFYGFKCTCFKCISIYV